VTRGGTAMTGGMTTDSCVYNTISSDPGTSHKQGPTSKISLVVPAGMASFPPIDMPEVADDVV
jgi:hypothetical protein